MRSNLITGLTTAFLLFAILANGQSNLLQSHDTSYYKAFPEHVAVRFYLSQKFTGLNLRVAEENHSFSYLPNTTRNAGFGITYKWATLNLAYGFSFLNNAKGRGKTKYLDLQSHQYLEKWNVDLFGQFYHGYYLPNYPDPTIENYVRPDLRVHEIGGSAHYVFNHSRFSFRAAFLNTEIQKKSAGTFLLGANVFYGQIQSDSSLIPQDFQPPIRDNIEDIWFMKMGPSAGYAHSFVFAKHLYLSLMLTFSFNAGSYESYDGSKTAKDVFYSTDVAIKSSIGYSNDKMSIGLLFYDQATRLNDEKGNFLQTGNLRFIVTHRFLPTSKKLKSLFKG